MVFELVKPFQHLSNRQSRKWGLSLADPVIHSDFALLHHSLTLCVHASAAEERAREEAIVDCYDGGLFHLIKTKV